MGIELPELGELFEDRYEILSILGEGGFARVFRARDSQLSRDVALKVISPRGGDYTDLSSKRFHREAQVIAGLQNPHTITLYDYGESRDGLLFMAFEYVAGEDLHAVLRGRGPMPPWAVAHVLSQLLGALGEAHDNGVLHRDIKPPNVLIHEYGGDPYQVKLLDFGIAKSSKSTFDKITKTGHIMGTPRYMAPEQVYGDVVTPATDLYCLGLVAFEMLVGGPAFDGASLNEVMQQKLSGQPVLVPHDIAPAQLRRVIERMVIEDASARFQSASAVRDALLAARREIRDWVPPDLRTTAAQLPAIPVVPSSGPPVREQALPRAASTWRVLALAAVVGVAAALVVVSLRTPDAHVPAPVRTSFGSTIIKGQTPVVEPEPAPKSAPKPDSGGKIPTAKGCSAAGARFIGEGRVVWRDDVVERGVAAYVPNGYDPRTPHPVVVVFHDILQSPSTTLERLGIDKLADAHGLIIVLPRSSGPEWSRAEVGSVSEAVAAVASELCVDTQRIYGFGHGAGGRAAVAMPCAFDDVAAIATTSFRPEPVEMRGFCRPERPVPYIHFAAMKDAGLPVAGGRECGSTVAQSLDEYEHVCRTIRGCRGEAKAWNKFPNGSCTQWTCESAPFVSCHVRGGREWAGPPRQFSPLDELIINASCDGPPADFPYASAIGAFFAENALPSRVDAD